MQGLPPGFEALEKLEAWYANENTPFVAFQYEVSVSVCAFCVVCRLATLNAMRAADSISEEQARQLQYDLDSGHTAFHRFLKKY